MVKNIIKGAAVCTLVYCLYKYRQHYQGKLKKQNDDKKTSDSSNLPPLPTIDDTMDNLPPLVQLPQTEELATEGSDPGNECINQARKDNAPDLGCQPFRRYKRLSKVLDKEIGAFTPLRESGKSEKADQPQQANLIEQSTSDWTTVAKTTKTGKPLHPAVAAWIKSELAKPNSVSGGRITYGLPDRVNVSVILYTHQTDTAPAKVDHFPKWLNTLKPYEVKAPMAMYQLRQLTNTVTLTRWNTPKEFRHLTPLFPNLEETTVYPYVRPGITPNEGKPFSITKKWIDKDDDPQITVWNFLVRPIMPMKNVTIFESMIVYPRESEDAVDRTVSIMDFIIDGSFKPGEIVNLEIRWKPIFQNTVKWSGGILALKSFSNAPSVRSPELYRSKYNNPTLGDEIVFSDKQTDLIDLL